MDQPTERHPPATTEQTDLVTNADFARDLPPGTVADAPARNSIAIRVAVATRKSGGKTP